MAAIASPAARLQAALAALDADRPLAARVALEALVADEPRYPQAWQALGAAARACEDLPAARAAFERVVALVPTDALALRSIAQVEADLGRRASAAFERAVRADPGNAPALAALAAAWGAEGRGRDALALLGQRLAVDPGWVQGQLARASLLYQFEGRDAFQSTLDAAMRARPRDGALAMAALEAMARAGLHAEVDARLPAVHRALGPSPPIQLLEATVASERGDLARADRLLAPLRALGEPVVDIAAVRHDLRARRPEAAAALAERMLAGPGAALAWPHLGTAWRMLGDPRFDWLEGAPGLVGNYDLGLDAAAWGEIAAYLRALHTARHAPYEQSLRGGTQTDGLLLGHEAAPIRALRGALLDAIARHIAQLPPADPRHPTLGAPRGPVRFTGSWSVRLTGGGHHVNHVHSEGWLSSACYVALPEGAEEGEGWLALGEPPVELGLDLPPTRLIRPKVGEVALFPSTMWHGTTPFRAGERLTVAFDVKPLV